MMKVKDATERSRVAREARYDFQSQRVLLELDNGVLVGIPTTAIRGLDGADARQIASVCVRNDGTSIEWPELDVSFSVPEMLPSYIGLGTTAREAARRGGAASTPAKIASSRANGSKGGRPLTMTGFVRQIDTTLRRVSDAAPRADTSDSPNPSLPPSAVWRVGKKTLLYVKIHAANEVQIRSAWSRTHSIEPRTRVTADRLARELAAHVTQL